MSRSQRALCALVLSLLWPSSLEAQRVDLDVFDRIRDRGTLRVGLLREDSFPFAFRIGSAWHGYDLDLVGQMAGDLGVALSLDASYLTAQDLLDGLAADRVDVALSKYKVNLDDALVGLFTRPYSRINYALMVGRVRFSALKMKGSPEQVFQNHAVEIGTVDEPRHIYRLRATFPMARVRLFGSAEELLAAVVEKRLTAAFLDEAEAQRLILQEPGVGLWVRYIELAEVTDEISIVVSWRNPFLLRWMDTFVASRGRPVSSRELIDIYSSGVTDGSSNAQ